MVFRFIEGYDTETVESMVGKRVGAVREQQHRAMATLRKILVLEPETPRQSY